MTARVVSHSALLCDSGACVRTVFGHHVFLSLSEEMDPPQTESGSEEWVNAWKAVCKDHPDPDFLQSYPEDTFGQMVVWVQGKLDPVRIPRQRCKDLLAM